MVEAFISKGLICFMSVCYPALFGHDTPTGTYPLVAMPAEPKYGGEVMVFALVGNHSRMSIHPPPTEKRRRLLDSGTKYAITLGCINVHRDTYQRLRANFNHGTIVIKE